MTATAGTTRTMTRTSAAAAAVPRLTITWAARMTRTLITKPSRKSCRPGAHHERRPAPGRQPRARGCGRGDHQPPPGRDALGRRGHRSTPRRPGERGDPRCRRRAGGRCAIHPRSRGLRARGRAGRRARRPGCPAASTRPRRPRTAAVTARGHAPVHRRGPADPRGPRRGNGGSTVTILVTICDWVTCDAPDDAEICGQPSRFCIERPGYIPSESCEEHLAAQVATLLEGEDITASVTVHWDGPLLAEAT